MKDSESEVCSDFHSCEYDIDFKFVSGSGWRVTINTGCRHKIPDTACVHSTNNEIYENWNVFHLDNDRRQIYSSYSSEQQKLKMSVLKSNYCCGILSKNHVKSLVSD